MRRLPPFAWAVIPLYLMLLAAPGYEIWSGVSPVSLWPKRWTLVGLRKGRVTRVVEYRLAHKSAVAKRLRPLYIEWAFPLFRIHPEKVMVGKDGWLFFAPTVIDYPPPGWRALAKAWGGALVALQRQFRMVKTTMVPIIVPNKATLAIDKLPLVRSPIYGETLRILRQAGVARLLDLRSALMEKDVPRFYRADSHWNQVGALQAARQIAAILRKAYPRLRGASKHFCRPRVTVRRHRMPGLLRMLGAPSRGRIWFRYTDPAPLRLVRQDCLDGLAKDSPSVSLAGTSFSVAAGWSRLLSSTIGRRVEDHAYAGEKIHGLVELVNHAAESGAFPDIVLLEFPERHLYVGGRSFLSQLDNVTSVLEAMRLPVIKRSLRVTTTDGVKLSGHLGGIIHGRTLAPGGNLVFRVPKGVTRGRNRYALFSVRTERSSWVRTQKLCGSRMAPCGTTSLFANAGYWHPIAIALRSPGGAAVTGIRILPMQDPGSFAIRLPSLHGGTP